MSARILELEPDFMPTKERPRYENMSKELGRVLDIADAQEVKLGKTASASAMQRE